MFEALIDRLAGECRRTNRLIRRIFLTYPAEEARSKFQELIGPISINSLAVLIAESEIDGRSGEEMGELAVMIRKVERVSAEAVGDMSVVLEPAQSGRDGPGGTQPATLSNARPTALHLSVA